MKRIISLILLASVLLCAFAACSESTGDAVDDTSAPADAVDSSTAEELVEETTLVTDDIPEGTEFDGFEFVIYNANDPANDWYTTVYVTMEEDSAEVLNSAIYNRNLAVEERLKIKLSEKQVTVAQIANGITAGDTSFSAVLEHAADIIAQAQNGSIVDLLTCPEINFTKPYWDQSAYESLRIGNKLFIGTGEFITTTKDETIVMFFNKKLITDYSLENPYQLVNDKKWTLDKLQEMGKNIIRDIDGDGKFNDQDGFALMSWSGVGYPYLFLGCGVNYMALDETGTPVITCGDERFLNVFEKVVSMCHSESDNFFYDANLRTATIAGITNNHRVQEIMFPNNQVLFWMECVSWSKALRDMDADFGIIPAPMFDETQEKYYNYCNCNYFPVAIPVTADASRTATVIEALNSASYYTTRDAYYEVMLKSKYSRDVESAEMLDIIFDNLVYDIGSIYAIGSLNSGIYDLAAKNNTDLASYLAKMNKSVTKSIERMIKNLTELD